MEADAAGYRIGDGRRAVFIHEKLPAGAKKTILFTSTPGGGQSVAFMERNWAARWYAFRVLNQFTKRNWDTDALHNQLAQILLDLNDMPPAGGQTYQELEIRTLLAMARDERGAALGEILSQDVEFITAFMEILSMTPGSHPATFRILHIASLIGLFTAMLYKDAFERPRPSWQCPALLPPVPVPGHSSYPSGHATQAHLAAILVGYMLDLVSPALPAGDLTALKSTLAALARRIGRNREIAGLHFPSDTAAGKVIAETVFATLSEHTGNGQKVSDYKLRRFGIAALDAAAEWRAS